MYRQDSDFPFLELILRLCSDIENTNFLMHYYIDACATCTNLSKWWI